MRISDQDPSGEIFGTNSEDANASPKSSKNETSRFSRTLAKKRDSHPANSPVKPKNPEAGGPAVAGDIKGAPTRFDGPPSAQRLTGATTVDVPPELQQLVREISLVVDTPGNQQVHIELNSNVLKGLQIHIERQNGAIAIQFQSASAEVNRRLTSNLSSLTQGLADRGVNVTEIRVNNAQSLSSAAKYKGSTPDRRSQSGRQGQRG